MSLYDYDSAYRDTYRRVTGNTPPDYKFSVAIPNKNTLKEYLHEGQRYIEGRKGTEYVLKFYNGSNSRVLVVMSVDGLSIMDGKPAGVGSNGYIVDRWQTVEIPGWRIDNGTVAKFVFRPQGDSNSPTYVEALRSEGVQVDASNQGVIGCLVFREKETEVYTSGSVFRSMGASRGLMSKGGPSLEGMSFNSSNASGLNQFTKSIATMDFIEPQAASASVGTGFGEDTAFKTRNVTFERANNYQPDSTIVLMYDTLAGLRKRGVPVDPAPNPVQNAFPNSPYLANDGCRVPKRRG